MSDDQVGYGKPPKRHRFRKGQSGNPRGRPKKVNQTVRNTEAEILKRLGEEPVMINGKPCTALELELRMLVGKAMRGELAAMKLLDRKRDAAGLLKPAPVGGVLVIPRAPSLEEWEREACESQRKYREQQPDDEDIAQD